MGKCLGCKSRLNFKLTETSTVDFEASHQYQNARVRIFGANIFCQRHYKDILDTPKWFPKWVNIWYVKR